jgi:hypothetical protein
LPSLAAAFCCAFFCRRGKRDLSFFWSFGTFVETVCGFATGSATTAGGAFLSGAALLSGNFLGMALARLRLLEHENRFAVLLPLRDGGFERPDPDCTLALPGPCDIVRSLHAHEGIHPDAEGLFDTQRHIPGQVGLAVEQAGQGRPGNLEHPSRGRHGQISWFDNLGPNEIPRMGRVQHTHGSSLLLFLVVILKIHVAYLVLDGVNMEGQPPVTCDVQAP